MDSMLDGLGNSQKAKEGEGEEEEAVALSDVLCVFLSR